MKLSVLDIKGKDTGRKVELSKDIFGIEPNEHAVYLDVKHYLANRRQGTHKTKGRAEVKGSTRKIKRQKGTGTARAGDIKNPLFKGGGRVFGPKPKDHGFKLNKKLKALARKSALSQKASEKEVYVLEDFKLDAPKTKDFAGILSALGLQDKKSLFVLGETDKNVSLSARNLQGAVISTGSNLNTYSIINTKSLVISEAAVKQIEENLSKK